MYDELVKRLRELQLITKDCGKFECFECENRELCDKHDNKTLSNTYKQAADAIEELQGKAKVLEKLADHWCNKAPKWVPVTERLPKADEEVLIYLWKRPSPYIAWVDPEGRWETNDFYVGVEDTPKAWMPLPEPPKEDE